MRFPFRALSVGAVFCVFFAYIATVAVNRNHVTIPSTQISSFAFLFCFLLILLVNPVMKTLRLRLFNRREIFLIFIMAAVPAGLPGYGFICQILPVIGTLHHPVWNTPQTQWDEKIVPIVDSKLFLGDPVFKEKDIRDWKRFLTSLKAAGETADNVKSPAKRMWQMLPDNAQAEIEAQIEGYDSIESIVSALPADLTTKARQYIADAAAGKVIPAELAVILEPVTNSQTLPPEPVNSLLVMKITGIEAERDGKKAKQIIGAGLEHARDSLAKHLNAKINAKKNKLANVNSTDYISLKDWELSLAMNEYRDAQKFSVIRNIKKFVLTRKDFYDSESFKGIKLPAEAEELLARNRDKLQGGQVERLNRYVLEASFPNDIRPNKFLRDQKALEQYHKGLQAENLQAYPVFIKRKEESFKEYTNRVDRYLTIVPELNPDEIKKWWSFYPKLADSGKDDADPSRQRVWNRISAETRKKITALASNIRKCNKNDSIPSTSLTFDLKRILENKKFFDPNEYKHISFTDETSQKLEKGFDGLSDEDTYNLNREILIQAFSREVFNDWRRFSVVLDSVNNPEMKPVKDKINNALKPDVKQTVSLAAKTWKEHTDLQTQVVKELNDIITSRDLWDVAAFKEINIEKDAKKLIAKGLSSLSEENIKRANRMIMEATYTGSFKRYNNKLWGDTPWNSWVEPLTWWIVIALILMLFFYALNELVFTQWYEREKLVFPIAQLTETVLSNDVENGGEHTPSIFKHSFFWVGFAISFGILLYNGSVKANWLDLPVIDTYGNMDTKFTDTVLQGLKPGFAFEIFFTCIGLAFLLPVEISFSVWFFYILMMGEQLTAVGLGHGINGNSFEKGWLEKANFMTLQGGGAMEVFGLIYLWRVRRQVVAFLYRLAMPNGNKEFSKGDIAKYSLPSLIFFITSAVILYTLHIGNVPFGMALLTYFALLLMTVATVRVVAECGIVGFQVWFGPIHLMKMFGLFSWTAQFAAKGLGTVILLLVSLFVDTKSFIAPTMMNAKYLSEKNKVGRSAFGIAVFGSIVITLVVSSIVAISMAYDLGVSSMNSWFYSALPRSYTLKPIVNTINDVGANAVFNWTYIIWFTIGGLLCGAMMFMRQFFFWVPHPIGLVMFINPKMRGYWFSFFVAWLCKRAAIKYCDNDGYKAVRAFFIGLIIGEIIIVCISTGLALTTTHNMGIDLNHN